MVLVLSTLSNNALYLYQVLHNSVKSVSGVMVLVLSTLSNNALYLYQVLHNSVKSVDGVMVLILPHFLIMLYICTKFCQSIS